MSPFWRKTGRALFGAIAFLLPTADDLRFHTVQSVIGHTVFKILGCSYWIAPINASWANEARMFYANPGFYAGITAGLLIGELGWNILFGLLPGAAYIIYALGILAGQFYYGGTDVFPSEDPIYFIAALSIPYSVLGYVIGVFARRTFNGRPLDWKAPMPKTSAITMAAILTLAFGLRGWMSLQKARYTDYRVMAAARLSPFLAEKNSWIGTYATEGGRHGPETVLNLTKAGFFYGFGHREDVSSFSNMPNTEGDWGTVEELGPGKLALQAAWRDDVWGRFGQWRGERRILYLIPWDDRLFPVYEDQMLEFANNVNKMFDGKVRRFSSFSFPYKGGKPAGGLFQFPLAKNAPVLPSPWNALILRHPIEARILEVGPPKYREKFFTERIFGVTLSAGAKQGLAVGHILHLANFKNATPITISGVKDDISYGTAVQDDYWGPLETQRAPRIGQLATSRMHYGDEWEKR